MNFDHDYETFPELTNTELSEIGFTSPHVQIESDFRAVVVNVHDGDTVTLRCDFRDFDFPLRFLSVDAPELSTGAPGSESMEWLRNEVEGREVEVRVDRDNRVEKYGRLLGDLVVVGVNIGESMVNLGFAFPFDRRREGELPNLDKVFAVKQWF